MMVIIALAVLAAGAVCAAPDAVFTGVKDDRSGLYKVDLSTMAVTPLFASTADDSGAAVSPDGAQLAFVSTRAGAPSLWLLDLKTPTATPTDISGGMGAYANPAFSPDGKTIAAAYGPNPEIPLLDAQLVLVDVATRKQTVLLDSRRGQVPADGAVVFDMPQWVDAQTIAFVEVEYVSVDPPKVGASFVDLVDVPSGKITRLAGGTSAFDAEGKARSWRASMPSLVDGAICFAAIEGMIARRPMVIGREGGTPRPFEGVRDESFFGPVRKGAAGLLYGVQDDNGLMGLTFLPAAGGPAKKVPFTGTVFHPSFLP